MPTYGNEGKREKTECMFVSKNNIRTCKLRIGNRKGKQLEQFKYLANISQRMKCATQNSVGSYRGRKML